MSTGGSQWKLEHWYFQILVSQFLKKNLLKDASKFQMPYVVPNTNAPNACGWPFFPFQIYSYCLK